MGRRSIFAAFIAFFAGRLKGQSNEYKHGAPRINGNAFEQGRAQARREAAEMIDELTRLIARMIAVARRQKPAPNECPRCGTAAPPFQAPSDWVFYPNGFAQQGKPVTLARCAHCSCAFWQDAEVPTHAE
jgi:hypothetical protein